MVDVAHSTARRTIAECVEDADTLSLVRAQGVDLAQGWYLGRPVPVEPGVVAPAVPRARSPRRGG